MRAAGARTGQQLATHFSAQGPEVKSFQSTSKTLWAVSKPPGPVTAAREHPCPSHICLGFFFWRRYRCWKYLLPFSCSSRASCPSCRLVTPLQLRRNTKPSRDTNSTPARTRDCRGSKQGQEAAPKPVPNWWPVNHLPTFSTKHRRSEKRILVLSITAWKRMGERGTEAWLKINSHQLQGSHRAKQPHFFPREDHLPRSVMSRGYMQA